MDPASRARPPRRPAGVGGSLALALALAFSLSLSRALSLSLVLSLELRWISHMLKGFCLVDDEYRIGTHHGEQGTT